MGHKHYLGLCSCSGYTTALCLSFPFAKSQGFEKCPVATVSQRFH